MRSSRDWPEARVLRYTLRIALRDHKPAIWRKVDVPSNLSLRHLGDLILSLMGWDGGHLNQFLKGECLLSALLSAGSVG